MRKSVAVSILLALVLGLALGAVACGTDVAGTYTAAGDDPEFRGAELVIDDDEKFELSAVLPDGEQKLTVGGTYTLESDTITLTAEGLNKTETGMVEEGRIVFQEVTWVKR